MKKYIPVVFALVLLVLLLVSISSMAFDKAAAENKDNTEALPVVGSYENLKALLEKVEKYRVVRHGRGMVMEDAVQATTAGNAPMRMPAAAKAEAEAAPAGGYSATNVQVQGVDEADIVKTDGEYIYHVNNRRVVVTRAYPAEEMQVASILQFDDEKFTPQELYVDQKYLVVVGTTYRDIPFIKPGQPVPEIYPPPYYSRSMVKAIVYDLRDKTNLKRMREVELEGYYVSSRKIGPALYLVANKNIDYHILRKGTENPAPSYRDTAAGNEFVSIDYDDIRYFPGFVEPNYMLIAEINLERSQEEAAVDSYLGAGENIYASPENLYVAVTRYEINEQAAVPDAFKVARPWPVSVTERSTAVYKFALDQGRASYKGKGAVPGTILNQFSMDEYNGYFRIATTRGDMWRDDEYTSKNNIYVLDEDLNIIGRIEDIAPGERIYSVRFMGDRSYMVTFKKVDPFFVIDLQDPKNPRVLGALKIPGYSDYLHPYDENHIIGFGKDTVEISRKDRQGNNLGSMAFYQGMKMAIFDVTDVQNPVEKFKVIIGDRGTDSELLRNHKALMFARDKNLLAFPVTVMEIKDSEANRHSGFPAYGQFAFQGAYVYNVDLVNGFSLKGRITHLTAQDYLKAGQFHYGSDRNVERIIYIGDTLYTISKGMLKAHQITDLKEINSLVIPLS